MSTIVIGNLQSPALYVSGFVAEVFVDSAYANKVASMSCGAVNLFSYYGSTTITQASVTASDTPQSVSVASLTISGHSIASGSILLVGSGATQEVVTVDLVSTASGIYYINAVYTQNHLLSDPVYLLQGLEPLGVWNQTNLMVANGLLPATTYYLAAGPQTTGGAVNWTYSTFTTGAAGTTYTGTYSAATTGIITYTLTPAAPPSDLLYYEAIWITSAVPPTAATSPAWTGTTTAAPSFSTSALGVGSVVTVFVRAVGSSGNYAWVEVDQRTVAATASAGSTNITAGSTLDKLVPYVSGVTPSFPPPLTLINPSFEDGNVGWTLGTNWSIGQGHPCYGNWSAYIAGSLTSLYTVASSITNSYKLPVTPSSSYFAQCMIDASSAAGSSTDGLLSTSSYSVVFLAFYTAANALISTSPGNHIPFGGTSWNLSRVQAVAPAGAAYALVGCTVNNQETGTVFVDDFEANALPPGPVNVPSGPVFVKLANVGADHNIHISTALNPQGSVLPNQLVPLSYAYTNSQVSITCPATSLLRADGTLLVIPGGTTTFTGLTQLTTYYLYPYIRVSDGTMQFPNATLPSSSPNPTQALQAQSDGCIELGIIVFTTVVSTAGVTYLGVTFPPVTEAVGPYPSAPNVSISISGDGTGATATLSWTSNYGTYVNTYTPSLNLNTGTGYTHATATVVVSGASGGYPYSNGTSTYSCTCGAAGGVGGGTTCPEAAELVTVVGRGNIPVSSVVAGDQILGHSFITNTDVYRTVIQTSSQPCASWRMIDGYRCSPTEPVYYSGAWMLAFRVPGATLDTLVSTKIMLSVQSDQYNEQNFYLVTGSTPLLIHNQTANPC